MAFLQEWFDATSCLVNNLDSTLDCRIVAKAVTQWFSRILGVGGPLKISKGVEQMLGWQCVYRFRIGNDTAFIVVDVKPNLVECCQQGWQKARSLTPSSEDEQDVINE